MKHLLNWNLGLRSNEKKSCSVRGKTDGNQFSIVALIFMEHGPLKRPLKPIVVSAINNGKNPMFPMEQKILIALGHVKLMTIGGSKALLTTKISQRKKKHYPIKRFSINLMLCPFENLHCLLAMHITLVQWINELLEIGTWSNPKDLLRHNTHDMYLNDLISVDD